MLHIIDISESHSFQLYSLSLSLCVCFCACDCNRVGRKRERERRDGGEVLLLPGCASLYDDGDNGVHERGFKHSVQSCNLERDELPCLRCLCLYSCCFYLPSCTFYLPQVSLSLSLLCLFIRNRDYQKT